MNLVRISVLVGILSIWSTSSIAIVSLNVKIGQKINNQTIEVKRTIASDYNKEIIIQDDSIKDKIIFSLIKFKNVLVNGSKIEPVQINLKTIDPISKISSKTQTVTSFYKNEANFKVSNENDTRNLEINLEFSETN